MSSEPDRPKPQQEASVAGPGSIAARQVERSRTPDGVPPMPRERAGTPAVGIPGASDQTDINPVADGLSGQSVNAQMPGGANVGQGDRTPPDTQEAPDPRGDARDPPPR